MADTDKHRQTHRLTQTDWQTAVYLSSLPSYFPHVSFLLQVFEKYVKERAEEERRERRNKLKTIRDGYQSLLEESGLTIK